MTELIEKFDFLSSIKPHLSLATEQNLSINEINPHIVGQERNGILLYTWFCKQANKPSKWKTQISVYDTTRRIAKTVFSHNDKIDVVNASVSQKLILLAFTVREKQPKSSGGTSEIFKSYLAEIAPQKRVFSLNIEWHTYQKVQFLYHPKQPTKELFMLFIHHKESIGLYHIPIAKLGDDGYVMSSQPKTEQIIRQFLWSQFDPLDQRLFFIQLNAQDEEGEDGIAFFNAIQFDDRGKHRYILNFQLPVSFSMELMRQPVKYFDIFLDQTVSSMDLNIRTLTSNKGAMMICYQHPQDELDKSPNNTPYFEDDTLSVCSTMQGNERITYTVFCIHGGYSITCSVSCLPITTPCNKILFTMFGDYLLVLLYGCFLHLLDCGSEHEPIHHILLADDACPGIPEFSKNGCLLSPAVWDYMPPMHHGIHLYDSISQKSFKMAFNHKALIKTFSTTRHASTRMAILHAAIVHIKDSMFSKKLIECLCQDPANLECSDLIKEYLVAYSYAHMKQQLSYFLLKPLPFSCLDPFRGLVERDRESKRVVFLAYKRFRKNLIDVLLYLLRGKVTEYWSYLQKNINLTQNEDVSRFPMKSLAFAHLDLSKKLQTAAQATRGAVTKPRSGLLRLNAEENSMQGIRNTAKEDEFMARDDKVSQMVTERVVAHIMKCYPRENKTKVYNICVEYASCRARVVKSLWKHLTKVLGYNNDSVVYLESLVKPPSATDFALFQMLERIHLSLAQLFFPEFRDMQNVMIALGYRCLPQHLFLQYLNASVFTVTLDFVTRFVTEVGDDDTSVPIKIELISNLPKSKTKEVLEKWSHPLSKRYLLHDLVGRFDGMGRLDEEKSASVGNVMGTDAQQREIPGSDTFLPLDTFLRSILLEERSKDFESHRFTDKEWQILTSVVKLE